MKIEIAHDSLAAKIYERVSVDEKARRKVEKFIGDRYFFYQSRNVLLTRDDLDYVYPYLDKIDIDENQRDFVKKSQHALRRRRRIMVALISMVFLLISTAALIAWTERNKAIEAQTQSDENARKAQLSELEAKASEKKAIDKEKEAQRNAAIADQQKDAAKIAEGKALEQERIAIEKGKLEEIARVQAENATEQEIIAKNAEKKQRIIAIKAKETAIAAEELTRESLRRSIAQNMSARSLLVSDPTLKGLIALQAFSISKNNKGNEYDPIIYDGLYYAKKALHGKDFYTLPGHTSAIRSIKYTSSGESMFTTGSNGKVIKWQVRAGIPVKEPAAILESGMVRRTLGISRNKEWLTIGSDREPYFQIKNLKESESNIETIMGPKASVWELVFSPDGEKCYGSSEDGKLWYYDFSKKSFHPFLDFKGQIKSFEISPDGKTLAGIDAKGQLHLWNVSQKNQEKLQVLRNGGLESLAFNHDGSLLALGGKEGQVQVWEFPIKSTSPKYTLAGHTARVSDLAFSSNSRLLASGGYDKRIQLWPISKPGFEKSLPIVLLDHNSWVMAISFSPDGNTLISGDRNGVLNRWPTHPSQMAENMCRKLNRNLEAFEWELYVGSDIPYKKTCTQKP